MKIVHWHSVRAPRRPAFTEKSELLALDQSFHSIRNIRQIIFKLIHKEVPIICYLTIKLSDQIS